MHCAKAARRAKTLLDSDLADHAHTRMRRTNVVVHPGQRKRDRLNCAKIHEKPTKFWRVAFRIPGSFVDFDHVVVGLCRKFNAVALRNNHIGRGKREITGHNLVSLGQHNRRGANLRRAILADAIAVDRAFGRQRAGRAASAAAIGIALVAVLDFVIASRCLALARRANAADAICAQAATFVVAALERAAAAAIYVVFVAIFDLVLARCRRDAFATERVGDAATWAFIGGCDGVFTGECYVIHHAH